MQSWVKATILLCSYGLFLYVKPSEPFLTPYLKGPVHNLTEEEVVNEIYPVWIYSYLAFLFPVFLLTDYVKYKPVIIFQCLGHISCWLLLIFGRGVPLMQLMQVFYAVATAAEIGYYSYIYSIVDEEKYQFVTSCVRATTLFGFFIGSLIGQLLVSLAGVDYYYLNVISLVNVSIAFVISWFLPMPKTTLFFYSSNTPPVVEESNTPPVVEEQSEIERTLPPPYDENETGTSFKKRSALKSNLLSLWKDAVHSYSNTTLLRWSIWWALSTCGWLLVVNYIQNLWDSILPSSEYEVYNGAVESVATVLGACGAFGVGYLKANWSRWGELSLGVCSLAMCGFLLGMYFTTNIFVCYAVYVAFIFLYNVVITITQYQIAVGLTTRRFALVFGINTFLALALNTALTIILIDKAGLALDVKTQFVVYSGYFGMVAMLFITHSFFACFTQPPPRAEEESAVVIKSSL